MIEFFGQKNKVRCLSPVGCFVFNSQLCLTISPHHKVTINQLLLLMHLYPLQKKKKTIKFKRNKEYYSLFTKQLIIKGQQHQYYTNVINKKKKEEERRRRRKEEENNNNC